MNCKDDTNLLKAVKLFSSILFTTMSLFIVSACTVSYSDGPTYISFNNPASLEKINSVFKEIFSAQGFKCKESVSTESFIECRKKLAEFEIEQIDDEIILRGAKDKLELQFYAARTYYGILPGDILPKGYSSNEYFSPFCQQVKRIDGVNCTPTEEFSVQNVMLSFLMLAIILIACLFFIKRRKRNETNKK